MAFLDQSLLVFRAKELLKHFPVGEGGKFQLRAQCEGLLSEIAAYPAPSGILQFHRALLMRALKKYGEASDLLEQLEDLQGLNGAEVAFYRAELRYLAGDLAGAERHFSAIDIERLRPSWRKSYERFQVARAKAEQQAKASAAYERLMSVEPCDPSALDSLISEAPDDERRLLEFVRARVHHICDGKAETTAVEAEDIGARPIFCCGFSWSGSGAVSAYLAQSRRVYFPWGTNEVAYLQGRRGVRGFNPLLTVRRPKVGTMQRLLVEFMARSVGNVQNWSDSSSLYPYYQGTPGGAEHLAACCDRFSSQMLAPACLRSADARASSLSNFLLRLWGSKANLRPVFNNVFMAPRIALARYMPKATFLAVRRDVRDQYVSRKFESDQTRHLPVDEFIKMIQTGYAKFVQHSRTEAGLLPNVIEVQFEDFVTQQSYRERLLDRLGIDRDSIVTDLAKFDPSVSCKNVGIHRAYSVAAELRRLAELASTFGYSAPATAVPRAAAG